MGKPLTASEETALLKDTVRQAHEVLKDLKNAIRQADRLADRLVADFEAIHHREIKQLSNYFVEESNRAAADLNAAVENARLMIKDQIMTGEAVFDRNTATVSISFGSGAFDDQVPPPYPHLAVKETDQ